jgi:uncharacterized membrane protein YbhN (UPF0104 family)
VAGTYRAGVSAAHRDRSSPLTPPETASTDFSSASGATSDRPYTPDAQFKRERPIPRLIRTASERGRRLFRGRWSLPLRLAITAGLLGLVVIRSDLWSLPADLSGINLPLLAAMLACSYAVWIVNTYRWQRILAGYDLPYRFGELFRLNLASVLYGLALPGQISGEVVKALRLPCQAQDRTSVYMSVFFDRVYGVIGLAVLGYITLALEPPPAPWVGQGPSLVVLATMALTGLGVLTVPWHSEPLARVFGKANPKWTAAGAKLLNLASAGRRSPPVTFTVGCALGLAPQVLTAAIHWGVAVALGLSISPLALTWIMAMATIFGMFPISLAGLGVREATYVGLLSLFGVPTGPALALSLGMFAILIALGLTGGLLDLLLSDRLRQTAP